VRHVRNSLRPRSIMALLHGLPLSFQRQAAGNLDAVYHFTFTGTESAEATVTIRASTIKVETGHIETSNLHVVADSETWLGFVAKEKNLLWALLTRKIQLRGSPRWLLKFSRCFPS
jgi:putative sterol carrier protein